MKISQNKLFRRLLAASLLMGGSFQMAAPLLAQTAPTTRPTAANTSISNTATATYDNDTDPNNGTFSATSNTVTITVAEVAGIFITSAGTPVDANGGTLQPNDTVNFDYTLTNIGNDATTFIIPNTASVTGPGTVTAVQYFDGTNYVPLTADFTTPSILPGNTVQVRVVVTVNSSATPTSQITATLGNTTPAGNPASTQNQPFVAGGPAANVGDVRTADNTAATTGEANPTVAPSGGEREASLTQSTTLGTALEIVNGPNTQPAATGPSGGTNDDFSNVSTQVPANLDPASPILDPLPVTITNTIRDNTGTDPEVVSVLPTVPTITANDGTNAAAIPNGTLVTISFGQQTATYTFNNGAFTFSSGTNTSATVPVRINIAAGATESYQVAVELPANTPQLTAYPVPITAFIDFNSDGQIGFTDSNANGRYDPGEETSPANTTINRVYTGFLRLQKLSRILQGTGPAVPTGQETFSTATKTPAAGNIIEYQITYTNVSTPAAGANNVILNANNLVITENGTTGNNTWARDNDNNGVIDTSNVPGTADDSGTGIVSFSPTNDGQGTTATTDVTQYQDTVAGPIAPTTTQTFVFQRRVN